MTLDLKALNRMLDELGPTVAKGNDTQIQPSAGVQTVGDNIANPYGQAFGFLSEDDSMHLQKRLNGLSWEEKGYLLQKQIAAGQGTGVPLHAWQANHFGQGNPIIQNALDTVGGGALIRQDLDPFLTSIF